MQNHEFWFSMNINRPKCYISAVFCHVDYNKNPVENGEKLILIFDISFTELFKSLKLEVFTIFVKTFFGLNIF